MPAGFSKCRLETADHLCLCGTAATEICVRVCMCRQLPHDCQLRRLEAVRRLPVMFYRPDTPAPSTFMQARSGTPVLALG